MKNLIMIILARIILFIGIGLIVTEELSNKTLAGLYLIIISIMYVAEFDTNNNKK